MKRQIIAIAALLFCFLVTGSVWAAPDPFIFDDQADAELNELVTSNPITVSGIYEEAPVSIIGGAYSINDGPYTTDEGTVRIGDVITVQLISSAGYGTTTEATLTIGDVSGNFYVTTKPAPEMPVKGHSECHCDGDGHCDRGCHCEGAIICQDGHCDCDGYCSCNDDHDRVFISCFIATAAFGSPLAEEVKILKQFRDRYLLTNTPGKKFVAWYYQNGPVFANWIQDRPFAKALVQTALYPLIGFSFLLISGYMPWILLGLILCLLIYLRLRPKPSDAV
jgi:hypothetical protein